ncbi:MAG: diguanylate cyclase [Anaerolineales bacterium]|nr:diguanylate cyclase [Anaerolineales bacterium]
MPDSPQHLPENIAFIEQVLNAFDEPFYVIRAADFQIVFANHAARKMGLQQAQTCHALVHHKDQPCSGADQPCPLMQVIQERKPFTVEHLHYKPDGSAYYAEVHGYPLFNEKGEVEFMAEYSVNITARKQVENQLRQLQRAMEFSANGVVITSKKGIIEYVNPAFTRITGYQPEEVIGQNPRFLKSGEHSQEFYANLWKTIQQGEVWRGEMTNRKKDGSLYWEYQTITPVKDENGAITHFVAIKENVTERKQAEQELERLAMTDPLTGLANRRTFFDQAREYFSFAPHPIGQLSVFMLDIDQFKSVNDQHGHAAGDEVLQEIAIRLNRNLRPGDLIGRYGGEEFSILLPRTESSTALQIAERLRLAVSSSPIETQQGAVSITVSIGICRAGDNTSSLDDLLHCADEALYEAKRTGRNRCVSYTNKS